MSIYDYHPILLAKKWKSLLGDHALMTFSSYKYVPQQVKDERRIFTVRLGEITDSWLTDRIGELPTDHEIALHSAIDTGNGIKHIPMVDFCTTDTISQKFISWIYESSGITLRLYDSGRSFHGYGIEPISDANWISFMGLILLANLPGESPLIDTRWVGHRLLAGYSSLRWSANSFHSLKLPTG
ncbi:hypothetical protein [Herbaspirillum rhizosphaerae]|uniref:primase 1D-like protein n=1 Tax=Herbaspirillum rhizosphaerae TaxID=346179 RepID=UPI000B2BD0EE|nr:hypothetical protein [Herbaspirillum rhizosphaerae]